ncbi:MAG: gluconokinase [Balneolaceae bacterium]
MILILMGVSGCGKTVIGNLLSKKLGLPFFDGDEFHPGSNIKKMESGRPLTDNDRLPWLNHIADKMEHLDEQNQGGIFACSALKKTYRNILRRKQETDIRFIYLKGERELIARRLSERENHFMPAELLDSQFNTLEEPEQAITVSIDQSPDEIVREIINRCTNSAPGKEN